MMTFCFRAQDVTRPFVCRLAGIIDLTAKAILRDVTGNQLSSGTRHDVK